MTGPTTAAPLGLRARKKRQTFWALQGNARRLVVERGLAGVTVEDIAAAAEVSKRTFFNYFDSKEAAIVDAEPGVTEQLRAALCARPASETPLQALRVAAVEVLVEQAPGLQELAGLVAANPVLALRQAAAFAMFHDVIVAWAAERTGCDPEQDVYPAVLAGVAGVMTQLTIARWRPETGTEGYLALADEIFAQLAEGLPGPPRDAPGYPEP